MPHSALDLLHAFARYKTHPGYVWAAVCADGGCLCENCVLENYRAIYRATARIGGYRDSQWEIAGLTNSGESETAEFCANCGKELWSDAE